MRSKKTEILTWPAEAAAAAPSPHVSDPYLIQKARVLHGYQDDLCS